MDNLINAKISAPLRTRSTSLPPTKLANKAETRIGARRTYSIEELHSVPCKLALVKNNAALARVSSHVTNDIYLKREVDIALDINVLSLSKMMLEAEKKPYEQLCKQLKTEQKNLISDIAATAHFLPVESNVSSETPSLLEKLEQLVTVLNIMGIHEQVTNFNIPRESMTEKQQQKIMQTLIENNISLQRAQDFVTEITTITCKLLPLYTASNIVDNRILALEQKIVHLQRQLAAINSTLYVATNTAN